VDPNAPVPAAGHDAAQAQPGGGEHAGKPRRQRKPIGPDANGLGPDGQPWDPSRRQKRLEERAAQQAAPGDVNAPTGSPVEAPAQTPAPEAPEAPKE